MGNRFGIHGLEAAPVHSERDVSVGRISNVSRPTEVPVSETRSDFGSSCPDPEAVETKFAPRYNGAQSRGRDSKSFLCGPEDPQTKRETVESSIHPNILLSPPETKQVNEVGKLTIPKEYISDSNVEVTKRRTTAKMIKSARSMDLASIEACLLYTSDAADE